MKLLMESWRKFLNERMEFGEGFERWLHGEIPDVFPGGQPRYDDRMDVDEPEFGQGGDCKPQSTEPECLEDYGFEKIGEGSFRAVWALPDNPNYVMKIADELWDDADTKDMNRQEADKIAQTGYPDLLPKVYDTADDYSWIVVERVTPYGYDSDRYIVDFFPNFVEFWKKHRKSKDFRWNNRPLHHFFLDYTERRRNELRGVLRTDSDRSILTKELGGEGEREELESQHSPLYGKFLEFIEHYNLMPHEMRSDNIGRASDGRFVILDSGWNS